MIKLLSVAAVILAACGVFTGLYIFRKREGFVSKTKKALAVTLGFLFFFIHLYKEVAIYDVRGVNMYSPFGENMAQTILALLLVWFTYAVTLSAVLSAFFDYKALHNITKFFGCAVLVLDLVFLPTFLVARIGTEVFSTFSLHLAGVLLELALTLALCAANWARDYHLPTKKEWLNAGVALPFALLAIIPAYIPQALLGFLDASIVLYDFTPHHRTMLYLAIIIPVVIFHAIKDKDVECKRFLMIYASLGMLFTFIARWELAQLKDPLDWPLHLCHTAMFLIPLCLIFRMRRLFNFCLFINVIGAFLAMMIPGDLDGINALATSRVAFWINHWAAFFMPVLLVALKIFKRPKFKEWAISLAQFAFYFFAILFVNAWLANYGDPDFFYLNSDFVVSNLGEWAERTRDIVVSFPFRGLTLTFYPLYQALFFAIYIGMTAGLWFLYALLFSLWDAAEDRREREKSYQMIKKNLSKFLGTKHLDEPVSGDASPSFVLRNFCKKYDTNEFYSVNNVSFEVKGGEIFGFLGPNGAGKSTIIKSTVGIQPVTSGEIEICGYNVETQAVQAKAQLGFVPDHYALYENLTGREYLNYIADLYQVDREKRDATIQKYVERFQLVDSFDNQMKTYSHGMKQKITIMAALVHDPKVWILDEPLTGLDPTSIHEVKQCMKEHAAAGNIVFFSSHIIDVVEKICDRIAIIKKGKLRACTKVSDLEENGIELEQFYLAIINADDDDEEVHTAEDVVIDATPAEEVVKA